MYFNGGVIEFQMLGGVSKWFHTRQNIFFVIKIVGDSDLSLFTDHLCCFMLYFVHTGSDGDIGQAQRCLPSERTQDMVAKSIQATITYPIEFL